MKTIEAEEDQVHVEDQILFVTNIFDWLADDTTSKFEDEQLLILFNIENQYLNWPSAK